MCRNILIQIRAPRKRSLGQCKNLLSSEQDAINICGSVLKNGEVTNSRSRVKATAVGYNEVEVWLSFPVSFKDRHLLAHRLLCRHQQTV